ncbi:MAG TPA: GTPase ObgE [Thermodesulfobacteriota bacterium]|nr:GTPase ObgE [Deltaproteobacteria bacterium]HNR12177.1 GTPase ObgE [Thermodesulfobacteriota bacterium]HNU72555.1 GTPase ObgE [Thermodesulfobacteriota bacterium]HOC38156.1 GTPase ObgE [Thermodesulfobacteriota bacterium]
MRFVDEAKIWVQGGDGGNGCSSFRREKFVPRGGPNGGNGGSGGNVVLVASNKTPTLLDHSYQQHYSAPRGEHGRGKLQHGKNGEDLEVFVPVGTLVRDAETNVELADLVHEGDRFIAAFGGRGGRGNASFKSSTNRAPQYSQPGEKGEQRRLKLELKLLAHVGLVGLPNSGKSTLISKISSAHPKIADYPFTTLTPHLGVVLFADFESMVVADIPGIIPGAHQGAGLGLRFLRHIERTSLLVFLIDAAALDPTNPGRDHGILTSECNSYSPDLLKRPQIIALNKMDMVPSGKLPPEEEAYYRSLGKPVVLVSARTGEGIPGLLAEMKKALESTATQGFADE